MGSEGGRGLPWYVEEAISLEINDAIVICVFFLYTPPLPLSRVHFLQSSSHIRYSNAPLLPTFASFKHPLKTHFCPSRNKSPEKARPRYHRSLPRPGACRPTQGAAAATTQPHCACRIQLQRRRQCSGSKVIPGDGHSASGYNNAGSTAGGQQQRRHQVLWQRRRRTRRVTAYRSESREPAFIIFSGTAAAAAETGAGKEEER